MAQIQPTEMEGVETNLMNEDEKRVLELYDRLESLQLEIALLRAQGVLSQENPPYSAQYLQHEIHDDIEKAEKALLESKATYQIRNNVIEQTLIANPIVKAVHSSRNATIAEQDLLPLIHKRDASSIAVTKLSTQIEKGKQELRKIEIENINIGRENAQLAAQMIALAAEANNQRKEDITDPKLRQQLDELEAEMKLSRQKWRVMKATASAAIVGSGVDWARDPQLLKVVLDEDEMGG